MNMDWLIGLLITIVGFLLYVAIPLVALWFIARGQKKTRIIVSIVSAIVIAVLAYSTGMSVAQKHMTRRYYDEFIRPFSIIMDKLQMLSDKGNDDDLKAMIRMLSDAEITATSTVGDTNTLWRFIDEN